MNSIFPSNYKYHTLHPLSHTIALLNLALLNLWPNRCPKPNAPLPRIINICQRYGSAGTFCAIGAGFDLPAETAPIQGAVHSKTDPRFKSICRHNGVSRKSGQEYFVSYAKVGADGKNRSIVSGQTCICEPREIFLSIGARVSLPAAPRNISMLSARTAVHKAPVANGFNDPRQMKLMNTFFPMDGSLSGRMSSRDNLLPRKKKEKKACNFISLTF